MQLEKITDIGKIMKKHDALSNICSTREASEMLGVSQRTVQLWVESGVLKAWKTPGGHRKISLSSVNQIIEKRHISIEMQQFISNVEFNIALYKRPGNAIQFDTKLLFMGFK